ncbi:PCDG4 protein, partial [Centropus bengalensis]|nr:PCDG4 protein [Centropus bengalensis]
VIESTPPGARFPLGRGRDPDIGTNSLQNYHLTPNPLFSLVVRESPDGTKDAELVLEKGLDREKQRNHHLILTAVDGGDPARSGTAQIQISVTDANDNPPVFTKEVYKVQLLENLPEGSLAFRVKATDSDEGTNAEITYSFTDIPSNARELFSLDSRTGDVKVTGPLDYEEGKYYEVNVEGKDGGGLKGGMQVHEIEVEITDVNDNTPNFREPEMEFRMSETTSPGSCVPLPEAHDPDLGRNSLQSYELSGDEHFSLSVQTGPGGAERPELVLAKALDREEASLHELVLRAMDGGEPSRTGTARVRVVVQDANDNAPVFSQEEYTVRVAEDVPVGSTLVTLTASDSDEGTNGHVRYS